MNPAIKIFETRIKIMSILASETCKNDDIPEAIKTTITDSVTSINSLIEELQPPRIQPATDIAKQELIEKMLFKNVELDIKLQELLFLILSCEYRDVLNTKLVQGDSDASG